MNNKIEQHNNELKRTTDIAIERVEAWYEEESERLVSKCQYQMNEYRKAFDEEAERQSKNFKNEALISEVVDWVTEIFEKTIKTVDRSNHVEKASVCIDLAFTETEIGCFLCNDKDGKEYVIGSFDYEKHRCEPLVGVMIQTAFLRLIAPRIKSSIIEKCQNEHIDYNQTVDIVYEYVSTSAVVRLIYKANNKDYKQIQKW